MRKLSHVLAVALSTALVSGCGDGPEREDDSVAEVMAETCPCEVQGYLDVATEGGSFSCEEASWDIEDPGVTMRLCLDYEGSITFMLPGAATFVGRDLTDNHDHPEGWIHQPPVFDFDTDVGSRAEGVSVFVTNGPATVTVRNRL